jgi:signal transduction histidine kinase
VLYTLPNEVPQVRDAATVVDRDPVLLAVATTVTALIALFCGAGGLILLAALCRRRVVQAAARERARLTHRIAERERTARELHDTLLQSVAGLALQLHAAVKQMPPDSPQRGTLERVLSRTNETLVGGGNGHANCAAATSSAEP